MSTEVNKFEQRKKEEFKRKQALKKMQASKIKPSTKKRLTAILVAVVAILIAAAIVFATAGFSRRWIVAEKVGSETVSTAEFSYYYTQQAIALYNQYYEYTGGSYEPFDTTVALSKQQYSEEQTWAEYFTQLAIDSIQQVKALSQEARANGRELSDEGRLAVENAITSFKSYASQNSMSLDNYLSRVYGQGLNEALVRKILTESQLATEYDSSLWDGFTYTEADLQSYFEANKENYSYVDVRYHLFATQEADEENGIEAVTLDDVKAKAKKLDEAATDEDAFVATLNEILYPKAEVIPEEKPEPEDDLQKQQEVPVEVPTAEGLRAPGDEGALILDIPDNSLHTQMSKASLNTMEEGFGDWAFDAARAAGDHKIIEKADGSGVYAVYLAKTSYRNDYNSVDMREIVITYDDDAEADESTERAALTRNEAKEKAQTLLSQWNAGEKTEDVFKQMAMMNNNDTTLGEGGLIERASKGTDAVSKWAFAEGRKAGDVEMLEGTDCFYLVYYVGENVPYWQVQCESGKRSEDYNTTYTALMEKYPARSYGLGIWLRDEPFV